MSGAGRTTAPEGRLAGRDPGLGAAEYLSPGRTRVIHRTACHAGVTGICEERVSAGVPNGIFKEVAQSLRFKIKGSAHNVGKAR